MGKVTVFVLLSGMVLMVYGVFASLVSKTGSAVSAGVSSFADLQAEIVTNMEVQAANEKAAEAADDQSPDVLDDFYGSLPLTEHALDGHQDEKWNAASIQSYFSYGNCSPQKYVCSAYDLEVHYCVMNDKKAIGLIVGAKIRQIVTGFMGTIDYWKNRCK